MKKFLSLTLLLLLAVCVLASCGGDGDNTTTTTGTTTGGAGGGTTTTTAPVTTTAQKVWSNPNVAVFADEIITWASDASADYYEVYLNGALHDTVANEYCDLDLADGQTATVKVVKVIDNDRYHSAEKSITRQFRATRTVTSLSELSGMASNGAISLGGLTEAAVVLDLSRESGTKSMPATLTLNTTLRSLTIISSSSLTLSGVTIKVAERTEPLTIVFRNVNLKSTASAMVYYDGTSGFTCDMLIEGSCSFTNTKNGATGSKGNDDSSIIGVAGGGGTGGAGGDIFALPTIRLFCEALPAFATGNGGNGGAGGTGTGALAHGGAGGTGGRGGSIFRNSTVTCFSAFFGKLSGDLGSGGAGGVGGSGISGVKNGSSGAAGAVTYGGSITYLSRTDGVIHKVEGEQTGDFNLSAVGNYLIWNAQPSVTRYELLRNGEVIDTTTMNAYVLSPLFNTDGLTVRAVLSSGEVRISKPCIAVVLDNYTDITPSGTSVIVTGAKSVRINAALLARDASILVMPDVEHLCLYGDGNEWVEATASITANNRTTNLAITLDNVLLCPTAAAVNTITVNGGQSTSAASDPMLIINSYDSGVVGGSGLNGADGDSSPNLSLGGNGANGGNGADGIKAPIVVITGSDFAAQGGNGGDGGDGGDSNNEGGDGGNGGNGGTAIRTAHLYLLMNDRNAAVTLYPGNAGSAGAGGNGFFGDVDSPLTSAKHGKDGSRGSTLIGAETILVGVLNK